MAIRLRRGTSKWLAMAAATSLFSAGCAQLPTDLSVQSGPQLQVEGAQDFVYYSPPGPVAGATPAEIVSGFLNAGTGPQNDYSIAREFLTRDFAPLWRPELRVLIRSSIPEIQVETTDRVPVRLISTAEVNENGEYSDTDYVEEELVFGLVQEDGQWRIDSAPDLTVVTQPVFDVIFQDYSIYFLDPTSTLLVPDLRWFPTRASTPTRLVNALLAGPADWLAPGVRSAIPDQTRLTVDAVRVVEGTALVDFDASVLSLNSVARSLMLEQLRATLLQLASVQEVNVLVSSNPQEITSASLESPSALVPAYLMSSDGIYRLTGGVAELIATSTALFQESAPTGFTVSSDESELAWASASAISKAAITSLADSEPLDERVEMLPPQFDSYGSVWVIPKSAAEDLRIYSASGSSRSIRLDLGEINRLAAAPSPDGTRIAEILVKDASFSVSVSSVIRDSLGAVREIGVRKKLSGQVGDPIDLAWLDATTLIVLERLSNGGTIVVKYPISGPRVQLTNPPVSAKQVASSNNGSTIYLLSEMGDVWGLTGSSWRILQRDATSLGHAPQNLSR